MSSRQNKSAFFITGTDTEIGKTVVSCGLVVAMQRQGRRVAALKPVASGCEVTPQGLRNADALALARAMEMALDYETINPWAFEPPIAPHIAAARDNIRIEPQRLQQTVQAVDADVILIEGVGGWCVPLGEDLMLEALPRLAAAQVILVVGLRLGCINHALLSARQIRADGFALAGWVANQIDPEMLNPEDNLHTLQQHISAPLLGVVPHGCIEAEQVAEQLQLTALL